MLQRKGQITVFIILGLVLLILFATVFYFYSLRTTSTLEQEQIPTVKEVPLEFQPISAYVESCIARYGEEALRKIGLGGGYINPMQSGLLTNPLQPTSASAVEFVPGSGLVSPYWFFLKSDNACTMNCEFSYNRPHLYRSEGEPSIEGQLDEYMNSHLADCLASSSLFQGFTIEQSGPIKTTTSVYSKDVGFFVNYPLKITKDGNSHDMNEFFLRIPVDLRSIYEQASVITELEAHYKFLEKDLLNLIVGYSGVDESKLPPMAATDFEFGSGKFWSQSKVKSLVQDLLVRDIPALQVYQSMNYHPVVITGDAFRETLYNSGMLVRSEKTFPSLAVEFNYLPVWPIYFSLNCNGDVCGHESASSNIVSLIGVQRYNFLYDVSFPVLVAISDPKALNNRGYIFQFFLEGNIRANEPLNTTYVPLSSIVPSESSMFCDPDKRNSGNITIAVKNANDKSPVDAAQITYSCAEESCSLGKTSSGIIKAQFPVCLGGVVSVLSEGFVSQSKFLSTEIGKQDSLTFELVPMVTLELSVQQYKLVKSAGKWVLRDNPVGLDNDEWGTLNLQRLGTLGEEQYSLLVQFNNSPQEISLAPGAYSVQASLLLNQPIIFRPQKRCENSLLTSNCFYVPQELMTIDAPAPVGGIVANYTFSDLSKKKITFYVIEVDLADVPEQDRVIEDLDQISRIGDYSNSYRQLLAPKIT
ncbi:MAG: hypothetical protein V1837_05705 [Candidatus Woesearchaeota archaeon]